MKSITRIQDLPRKVVMKMILQVNLCQKLSFFLSFNPQYDERLSLNPPKNTSSEHVAYKYCFECQNKNKKKQFLYTKCCELVFFLEFNEQSCAIMWVN